MRHPVNLPELSKAVTQLDSHSLSGQRVSVRSQLSSQRAERPDDVSHLYLHVPTPGKVVGNARLHDHVCICMLYNLYVKYIYI